MHLAHEMSRNAHPSRQFGFVKGLHVNGQVRVREQAVEVVVPPAT